MYRFLLIVLTSVAVTSISAQTELDFLNALGSKNTTEMVTYLNDRVIVTIEDKRKSMSKTDAIAAIQGFLGSLQVSGYKVLHTGKSSDQSSSYRVGRLKTDQGVFRIFAYAEKGRQGAKVIEIRIDKM